MLRFFSGRPTFDKIEGQIRLCLDGIVVLMATALPLAVAADVRVVEEIAAKVNGDIITRGELEKRRPTSNRARGKVSGAPRRGRHGVAANALRGPDRPVLLVQKGKDLNINVDPEITATRRYSGARARSPTPTNSMTTSATAPG